MEGVEGFRFMSFHFKQGGMRLGLWFTVFLTWLWNVFVGSEVDDWKLFVSMKSCILLSYWCIGKTTKEFPLSAEAIMASLFLSLYCIDFKILASVCVLVGRTCGVSQCGWQPVFCNSHGQRGRGK